MDTGDTAWLLASTALVLLMAPGLAFFYGGMVRSKSVLNIMMMVFYALAIFPIVWFLFGYSMAFGDDVGGGLLGGGEFFGLRGIAPDTLTGTVPNYVFVVFQMLFGVITDSDAHRDRRSAVPVRFGRGPPFARPTSERLAALCLLRV